MTDDMEPLFKGQRVIKLPARSQEQLYTELTPDTLPMPVSHAIPLSALPNTPLTIPSEREISRIPTQPLPLIQEARSSFQESVSPSRDLSRALSRDLQHGQKREGRPPLSASMSDESKYLRSVSYFLLPPTQEEMYLYCKRYKWWLIIPSLFSFTGLCMSQVKFASISPWLWIFFLLLIFTFLYYFLSLAINLFTPDFEVKSHKRSIEQWKQDRLRDGQWPSVDVFLPICGEPLEVLRNTWKLVMEMCKHYPGKTTVYILDDANSSEAKEEAERFQHIGFRYIVRPNRGVKKKAGNLKYSFDHSDGDAILIFDADFCPHREMILHMLPYMWNDEHVGIVQSPQYFRTSNQQNWLARGASAVQELFYRYVQVSRNHHKGIGE